MHLPTYEIERFESPKAAKEAGFKVPLTNQEYIKLTPMSTVERKSWHESKTASRNAAKRARKARRKNRQ